MGGWILLTYKAAQSDPTKKRIQKEASLLDSFYFIPSIWLRFLNEIAFDDEKYADTQKREYGGDHRAEQHAR